MNVGEAVRQRIIQLCQERGISFNRLSSISGVTQSTVNNIIIRMVWTLASQEQPFVSSNLFLFLNGRIFATPTVCHLPDQFPAFRFRF